MLNLTISVTKAALLGLWLACILSMVSLIPAPYGQTILWLGGVVLLIHFAEYWLVRSKVAERQEGKTGFVGTMVYGFGYWLPVLRRPL
jgi:uncharacterized protein YhhL (DUF1145 family)